jgi:hypothetical protein
MYAMYATESGPISYALRITALSVEARTYGSGTESVWRNDGMTAWRFVSGRSRVARGKQRDRQSNDATATLNGGWILEWSGVYTWGSVLDPQF